MGDEHPRLPGQQSGDAFIHQMSAYVRINRRQRIVQKKYVCILVTSAREGDAMPLAPAEVDALLSDLRQIPRREDPQVWLQGASTYHALVPISVVFTAEKYVFPHGHVLNPWVLLRVRNGSIDLHHGRIPRPHLT